MDERPGTLRVDLARFEIPRPRNKYGLVVNVGTTDLASPAAAFALMHEMCAEGGFFYHDVPLFGLGNHGLTNPTPKFWHALIWMNGYKAHSVRARTVDETALDRGNFFHDYLDYMEGLRQLVNVSSLITVVLEKATSWPFVVPFDAVFDDDASGQALTTLLVGSYRPFVATGAYTEQEAVAGINNFLGMNGRSFRLASLSELDASAGVRAAPRQTRPSGNWLRRMTNQLGISAPAQSSSHGGAPTTEAPPQGEAKAANAPGLTSADEAVIRIAGLIESGDVGQANDAADQALAAFPADWRIHQQKARALERSQVAQALPIRELEAATHLFAAAGLAAQDADCLPRASAMISVGRGHLEAADAIAARRLTPAAEEGRRGARSAPPADRPVDLAEVGVRVPLDEPVIGARVESRRVSTWAGTDDFTEIIDSERLASIAAKGGAVVHGHFFPGSVRSSPLNLYAVNTLEKMLVHVRDPRQTVMSWAHYTADKDHVARQAHNTLTRVLSHLSLEDRIDWSIDVYLPRQLEYLGSWMDGVKSGHIKAPVLFLKQEELVRDSAGYFNSILDFYAIDRSLFTHPAAPEPGKLHFRAGQSDEWRTALSPSQVARVRKRFPTRSWSTSAGSVSAGAGM